MFSIPFFLNSFSTRPIMKLMFLLVAAVLGYLICSDSSFGGSVPLDLRRSGVGDGSVRIPVTVRAAKRLWKQNRQGILCVGLWSLFRFRLNARWRWRDVVGMHHTSTTYVMPWVSRVRAPIIIIAAKWVVLLVDCFISRHRNVLDNYISHWLPFRNDLYFTLLIRLSACDL